MDSFLAFNSKGKSVTMRPRWRKLAVGMLFVVGMATVSFHCFMGGKERLLITSGDPLRVAVFGSSHSWGAALSDRFKAYPYRLSPRVENFAYFASGTFD